MIELAELETVGTLPVLDKGFVRLDAAFMIRRLRNLIRILSFRRLVEWLYLPRALQHKLTGCGKFAIRSETQRDGSGYTFRMTCSYCGARSVGFVSFGYDDPELDAVVNARPRNSTTQKLRDVL